MYSYLRFSLACLLALLSLSLFSAVQANDATAMQHDMSQHAAGHAPVYRSLGVIKKVTPDTVSIAHQAIPDLNWPPMTMQFALPQRDGALAMQVGEKVSFTFSQNDNGYQLVSLTPQH
ncbi:copper-binding protein [Yokenella regensburgei]|uniref:copper-binding protein n=1 Tax=Yokenella regensburgei TaxID=158877 RepID=UPI003F16174A